jgi:hypothetical protein
MSSPKMLSDLKHFANVFSVDTASVGIQREAERVFNETFGEDTLPGKVKARFLFAENDSDGNQVKVYEAYKDSGSEDYIYLTVNVLNANR